MRRIGNAEKIKILTSLISPENNVKQLFKMAIGSNIMKSGKPAIAAESERTAIHLPI
jgi:hypothetical protein